MFNQKGGGKHPQVGAAYDPQTNTWIVEVLNEPERRRHLQCNRVLEIRTDPEVSNQAIRCCADTAFTRLKRFIWSPSTSFFSVLNGFYASRILGGIPEGNQKPTNPADNDPEAAEGVYHVDQNQYWDAYSQIAEMKKHVDAYVMKKHELGASYNALSVSRLHYNLDDVEIKSVLIVLVEH
jgi:hypothetical protein